MKNGWQTKKLGELCEIELGKTPARANEAFWDEKRETSNVWLSIADLLNSEDNVVLDSKEYLSDKGAAISKTIRKGTLLASFKLTLGRLAFAGRDLFTNEAIAALTIFNERELSKEFLFYFLHFFDWRKAAENDVKLKGMTLNKAKLKELHVHFPTLPEQQRIVGILDKTFGGIATAKANAEKNLQNARAIFESHLQSVFTKRGAGWIEKPLANFARSISTGPFGSLLHKSDCVSNGVPLVNPINIVDGSIVPDGDKLIDQATKQRLQSYVLQYGDIVIGRRGEIGRCAVVGVEQAGWMCGTGCFFIRPLPTVNSHFLANLIRSSRYREQLERASTGTTMLNLSNKALGELHVAVPGLQEQEYIIGQIDSLRGETQRLESLYQRKLAALVALKKSLRHQAFGGQL